jgi:hypothetical protein
MEKMNVILECDGKIVALNPFVKKIFANTILGMVESLDKIKKNPRQIYLALRREAKS